MTTTPSTVYGASPFTNPPAGIHDDYTIKQTFEYGNGVEPQAGSEDMKRWVVDSPAGLAGNPNAIAVSDRCDPAAFDPSGTMSPYVDSSCPSTAQVGVATVYLASDAVSNEVPAGSPVGTLTGQIYILKTDPEVPTTLGTRFTSTIYQSAVCSSLPGSPSAPCTVHPKTRSKLGPVTFGADGDFRIRTIPMEDSTPPVLYGPTGAPYPHPWFAAGSTPLHIYRIDQHLYGMVNGQPFLTYPTRCDDWNSYSYITGTGSNTNANSDPDPAGHPNEYFKGPADTVTPDCSTKPALNATAKATLSTTARDSNPQIDFTVTNTNVPGDDVPKQITTTLPASITTDLQNTSLLTANECTETQADSGACPASAKVGSAAIATPFIVAGLTGDVYAVKTSRAIPDLEVEVGGTSNAINFRLRGVSNFVGPNGNQIQTVFSNLPQTPFSEFKLTIAGGKDSLLTISKCPDKGTAPEDGAITFGIDGYTGASASSSTTPSLDGCYGKPTVKSQKRCVKHKLVVKPSDVVTGLGISKMELYVGKSKRKVKTRLTKDIAAPWKLQKRLSHKFKSGKTYYFNVKVTYKPTPDSPSGKTMKSKTAKFKRC